MSIEDYIEEIKVSMSQNLALVRTTIEDVFRDEELRNTLIQHFTELNCELLKMAIAESVYVEMDNPETEFKTNQMLQETILNARLPKLRNKETED